MQADANLLSAFAMMIVGALGTGLPGASDYLALCLTFLANRHWVVAAWLLLIPTRAAVAANLTGQASIIDGDTLEIQGAHIRL